MLLVAEYPTFLKKINRLYYLEKFYVHSKFEQKVQRVLVHQLVLHMFSLSH